MINNDYQNNFNIKIMGLMGASYKKLFKIHFDREKKSKELAQLATQKINIIEQNQLIGLIRLALCGSGLT